MAGDTLEEAIHMTCDAIESLAASVKKHGQPIPGETSVAVAATVAA